MQTYLYLNEIDTALFPELKRAPGVYAIEAVLVAPGVDPRIPVPEDSALALRVSYRLLAAEVPAGSGWQLEIARTQADGKQHMVVVALMKPPPARDNFQTADPPFPDKLPEGTVDRAVFWVDLSPLLRDKTMLPGDTLTLRYGNASARIVLPVAGPRPAR